MLAYMPPAPRGVSWRKKCAESILSGGACTVPDSSSSCGTDAWSELETQQQQQQQQHGSTSSSSRAVHDSYAAAFCFRWFGADLRHDDGDIIRVETAVQPPAEVHATRASHLPPPKSQFVRQIPIQTPEKLP